jgi:hypothetical protein
MTFAADDENAKPRQDVRASSSGEGAESDAVSV